MDLGGTKKYDEMMLKYGLEIDFVAIQEPYAAIFEMLIFRNFSGGQSPKFCQNGENYDPILERRKIGL